MLKEIHIVHNEWGTGAMLAETVLSLLQEFLFRVSPLLFLTSFCAYTTLYIDAYWCASAHSHPQNLERLGRAFSP